MKRHSLVCRLGSDDRGILSILQPDSIVSEVSFVAAQKRLDFGLGQVLDRLRARGFQPNETALDLVLLASVIFLADTRICRTTNSQDGWTREIDLYLPVKDLGLWSSSEPLLTKMLNFLSGDRWRLFFRNRPERFKNIVKAPSRKPNGETSCVCLLSGGLDSFVGAIDLLAAGETPVFMSHYWEGVTSDYQTRCIRLLEKRFGSDSHLSIRARVGFPVDCLGNAEIEQTQRSRSFLFFALATLTASGLEDNAVVHVPENGFISLNVPLDPLRLGALSTRTTHPFFMARWGDLLLQLGLPVSLVNRYRHQTKGQIVASCRDRKFLRDHANHTMSCSSPTKARWSGSSPRHCGYCVPCIIRRAGLIAGQGVDDTPYTIQNLRANILDSTRSEGEHIRSFQVALSRIAKSPEAARYLIHKPGPLTDYPDEIGKYQNVYIEGLREVGRFLEGVRVRPQ